MQQTHYLIPEWPAPSSVACCITTRNGGKSLGNYANNNLALHVGDQEAVVQQNRDALCKSLELNQTPQWLEQIHGVRVVEAKNDGRVRTADASFTREKGVACAVMTADCLPILVCNQQGTQVAAVHAGWRGLAKGVVSNALTEFKCPMTQIMAYLGPAISQPHFEVGIEVLEEFFQMARTAQHADAIGAAFKPSSRPLHFHADIYALARAELQALGVTAIYGGNYCTYADAEHFYSYRRDKTTGRMASLIWLQPSS